MAETATLEQQQTTPDQQAVETQKQEAVQAAQEFFDLKDSDVETESVDRARDEKGRFVGETPKFDPLYRQAAKDVYFTDAEIDSFTDENLLRSAILGRKTELQSRWQQPNQWQQQSQQQQTQQQTQQPPVQSALDDFKPVIDENADDYHRAFAQQSSEYINKLKASLVAENAQLRQHLQQLTGTVEQSVQSAQSAATMQQAQEMDRIASAIPGMVEFMGKPSEAMNQRGSMNHTRWAALTPAIEAKAMDYARLLGPERIDANVMQRIIREAYEGLWPSQRNGQTTNNNGAARQQTMPKQESRRSNGEQPSERGTEFDKAVEHTRKVWNSFGRNPFAGD